MQDPVTLETLDRDGAIRELGATAEEAVQTGEHTRASFLTRGGALVGGGLVLGSVPIALAGAKGGGLSKTDTKILNYALTLEYLESAFYAHAIKQGHLTGNAAAFAKVVGAHEAAHVKALQGVLGSAAVKTPAFDFMDTASANDVFLTTAMTLEDTGVAAYQGQATEIQSAQVLASAGAILAVEARHAAWVRDLLGHGRDPVPAPDAFSQPMSMSAVLSAVKGTGFIK